MIYDRLGGTLTIWLDDPQKEDVCEETADEVVLMKDGGGRVIGFEVLGYHPPGDGELSVSTQVLDEAG